MTVWERFFSKVDRRGPDECWPWLGSTDRDGRGSFYLDGRTTKAPRVAWELANGSPLPKGLFACHKCDNPNCVNPAHIWPGTPLDNLRDAARKGRVNVRAANAARLLNPPTHCKHGHALSGYNLIIRKNGNRSCRECGRRRGLEYNKKRPRQAKLRSNSSAAE